MNKIGVGYASITELEKKYVNDALDNSRLSQGKYVALFEKKFAQMHGQEYGIMCNSGTSALHVALEVLKETEGWSLDAEILVPAITFIATSNSCIHAGLNPVFVDVDPITYNINPNEIVKKITAKTKCIIVVHAFGLPCEMEPIITIAKDFNLKIIEDCAEAHFALYKGKPVGCFSDLACYSTYVAHTITTGVGGIITTNNLQYAEISRSYIAHGRACTCETCIASSANNVCKKRMDTEIDRRFMFVRLGYSYRVGELEGALGLAQLERAEEIMEARRTNAVKLTNKLIEMANYLQLPEYPPYMQHTFMMYPIVVKDNDLFDRNMLVSHLENNNIETRPMLPLLNQPIYKRLFGQIENDFPSASLINRSGLYIGIHHGLVSKDIETIYLTIRQFIDTLVKDRDYRYKG